MSKGAGISLRRMIERQEIESRCRINYGMLLSKWDGSPALREQIKNLGHTLHLTDEQIAGDLLTAQKMSGART